MKSIPPYWKPFLEMMTGRVADAEFDKAQLTLTSAAFNAEKIKTPLFVAQGVKDPQVVKAEEVSGEALEEGVRVSKSIPK